MYDFHKVFFCFFFVKCQSEKSHALRNGGTNRVWDQFGLHR